MDYIERHIGDDLSLEALAEVANFSKYHFHRIFFAMTGETLFHFIQRVRLEKAAGLLVMDTSVPITTVGYDCGFASPQSFAKSFKERYGVSASKWRATSGRVREDSNLGEPKGNSSEAATNPKVYIEYRNNTHLWRFVMENEERTVEVREMPAMTVAYIRHVGPYMGDEALFERLWGKLMQWAVPRGLVRSGETSYLCIYHDNPEITEHDKLRLSVCITVPPDTDVSGEVGMMNLEGGKYAVARFMLGEKDYGEAWNWLYATWLPNSGYVPDDRAPFEMYPEESQTDTDAEGHRPVDICIPVRPM
jgi:AraC family transcriptional regulator